MTHVINPSQAYAPRDEFWRGVKDLLPLAPGFAAWALVTGALTAQAGIPTGYAVALTVLIYAGSAQLAALPLIAANAPLWLILVTAFCVNLRFVIFSLYWRDVFRRFHFGQRMALAYFCSDVNYVLFVRRYADPAHGAGNLAYFWGLSAVNFLFWNAPAIAGILAAEHIPAEWNIQFAGTLAVLAVLCSLIRTRACAVVMLVSAGVALATAFLPFRLNIVTGILAAGASAWVLHRKEKLRHVA